MLRSVWRWLRFRIVVALMLVIASAGAIFQFSSQAAIAQSATTLTTVITTTKTYYSGPQEIPGKPPDLLCGKIGVPLAGTNGQHVSGLVTSNTPITFYVMPDSVRKGWPFPCKGAPNGVLIRQEGITSYTFSFDFPQDGTYWFFFLNFLKTPAEANFELVGPVVVTSSTTVGGSLSQSSYFSSSPVSATVLQTTTGAQVVGLMPYGNFGLIGIVAAVVLAAFALVVARRRKSPPAVTTVKHEGFISTGYTDLDGLLGGGIPERYGVVVVSPAYDERDFLLRKIIGTALSTSTPVFYLASDTERTGDYLRSYAKDFYAFSPQADKIEHPGKNLYKIPGVENLSELNISFSLTSPMVEYQGRKDVSKIIILDLLSDILLRHKALTTRKWLSDFIAKRKTEAFTIIASLNPLIAKEEAQTIIDLFDGVIEIYERELSARPRRFLLVKKLYAKKYSENELLLDRDKLFSA